MQSQEEKKRDKKEKKQYEFKYVSEKSYIFNHSEMLILF